MRQVLEISRVWKMWREEFYASTPGAARVTDLYEALPGYRLDTLFYRVGFYFYCASCIERLRLQIESISEVL